MRRYCWINLVVYFVCELASLLILFINIFVDNKFKICIWDRKSKDWFV